MDKRMIEQLELDLDETLNVEISEELETQLQALADAYNMNLDDYLDERFVAYLERRLSDDD